MVLLQSARAFFKIDGNGASFKIPSLRRALNTSRVVRGSSKFTEPLMALTAIRNAASFQFSELCNGVSCMLNLLRRDSAQHYTYY